MSSPPEVPADDAEAAKIESLKSALWLPLGRLTDAQTLASSSGGNAISMNASPQFIGALTEMVWSFLAGAAGGLEEFARHADRTVVLPADVLLLAKGNPELKGLLGRELERLRLRRV